MVTREYSSAQKILEEFKSKHETQELTRINPQTCRLEISNKGKEAVFSMPDEHGYGDSKNTTHNKAIENHKINHLKNHEDLDGR